MEWLLILVVIAGSISFGSVVAWSIARRGYMDEDLYPWNWRILLWPTLYLNWLDNKEETDG